MNSIFLLMLIGIIDGSLTSELEEKVLQETLLEPPPCLVFCATDSSSKFTLQDLIIEKCKDDPCNCVVQRIQEFPVTAVFTPDGDYLAGVLSYVYKVQMIGGGTVVSGKHTIDNDMYNGTTTSVTISPNVPAVIVPGDYVIEARMVRTDDNGHTYICGRITFKAE